LKGTKVDPKALVKSLLILSVSVGVLLLGYYEFFVSRQPTNSLTASSLSDNSFGWKIPTALRSPNGKVINTGAFSNLRAPGGAPRGLPVRLKIPIIGVDTAIEDAYITPDGRMDVPAGSRNVAWYANGPVPGHIGSSVIGGHFGLNSGVPTVFYNLDKLRAGNKVYIENDKNETLAFVVRSIRLFNRDADATPVFISNDNLAHLNLITCEGVWNKVDNSYPDRRVVFTEAIPSEGKISVVPLTTVVPKPSLPVTAITPKVTTTPIQTPTPTPAIKVLVTPVLVSTGAATPVRSTLNPFQEFGKTILAVVSKIFSR
jgi:LPXTG-site transpeptidase (sortase) family protein